MMENGDEFSSSINFASSSSLSNGPHMPSCSGSVEFLSLNELSSGLEKLLTDAEFDYSDAEIVVEGVSVGVNRCILAARSRFFHDKFKKERGNQDSAKEPGKPRILMTELVPCGKVGYEAFLTVLNYLYTGKLRTYAPEVSTCVDESCVHHACRPAIDYAVELMYASATFQITELVMVFQVSTVCFSIFCNHVLLFVLRIAVFPQIPTKTFVIKKHMVNKMAMHFL